MEIKEIRSVAKKNPKAKRSKTNKSVHFQFFDYWLITAESLHYRHQLISGEKNKQSSMLPAFNPFNLLDQFSFVFWVSFRWIWPLTFGLLSVGEAYGYCSTQNYPLYHVVWSLNCVFNRNFTCNSDDSWVSVLRKPLKVDFYKTTSRNPSTLKTVHMGLNGERFLLLSSDDGYE